MSTKKTYAGLDRFRIVAALMAVAILWVKIVDIARAARERRFTKGRAWAEIDLGSLQHNIMELRHRLPKDCQLMPAVKADAYGHGGVPISRALNGLGVRAFCVATAQEAIALRRHGVKGEILVLGYTHPQYFASLRRYRLMQTVVDHAYAELLNAYGKPIKVHIKIDTGMHRLGESYKSMDELLKICRCPNLSVEGAFTHLCMADSGNQQAVAFTNGQIEHFYQCVQSLKAQGVVLPRLHIQNSGGILNYPGLHCDYARVGIAMYGAVAEAKNTLHPVLSIRARIVMIRTLQPGEAVGYDLQYTAEHDIRAAIVSIGYADGIPRSLSCGAGHVLVNGQKAPIIGRICMDQMMVDITDIPGVQPNDIVTVLGRSGQEQILATDMAEKAGTIANEILCRLGERLERVYCASA